MDIGDRMKQYERACELDLIRRLPVIIRLDGKGFSKFTKKIKAEKPFDEKFCQAMANAMLQTASKIEGCVFGLTQSDEVTLVLMNDQSNESEPWFGNRTQKICSVTASMMTAHFNVEINLDAYDYMSAYFDARVFTVPTIQEAVNCIIWRQNDATKNSISAACYYEVGKTVGKGTARKLMHKLNQDQQQELLFQKANINWNDYPAKYKRGIGCYRVHNIFEREGVQYERYPWELDYELPIISQDQEFAINIITRGKAQDGD